MVGGSTSPGRLMSPLTRTKPRRRNDSCRSDDRLGRGSPTQHRVVSSAMELNMSELRQYQIVNSKDNIPGLSERIAIENFQSLGDGWFMYLGGAF